jgi:hypothetical protein
MIGTKDVLRGASALLPLLSLALAAAPSATAATDRPLQSVVAPLVPAGGTGDLAFIVGGDNRPTAKGAPMPRVVKTLFDEIALVRPAFVLWSGDTVYGYCDTREELRGEYEAFLALATRGAAPLFNAPGNHEIHSGQTCPSSIPTPELCGPPCSEEVFQGYFGQLYGSFDYAGAHFIALDTDVPNEEDAILGKQLEWLQQDLERNKTARAIFLFSHTEFYSSPLIDPPAGKSHPAVKNGAELHQLFRRYPVKAVFSGHEHVFWREPTEKHDGIAYFVAGGAGAPLYASPDRGGFSHYLIVRLAGDQVSYDLIEPGHLYVEPAAGTATEARFWIVNSTDSGPLTLRGVETEVPASLGGCGELTASATLPKRDGSVLTVPMTITACTPGTIVHKLRMTAEGMPAGTSMPVVVRHKG